MRLAHAFIFTVTVCLAVVTLIVPATIATAIIGGPCATEDDQWCYWDAYSSGNGQGRSFVSVGALTIYYP